MMKNLFLGAAITVLFVLTGCSEAAIDEAGSGSDSATAKAERLEAKAAADLSKMDVPEIIDYVNDEADDMTALLQTVTDGPSAEAAVEEIRLIIPRLNASIKSLENMDVENVTLNIGNMRKMMKVAQSQSALINEVVRISNIPEARDVLEKEFDKIEISNN